MAKNYDDKVAKPLKSGKNRYRINLETRYRFNSAANN